VQGYQGAVQNHWGAVKGGSDLFAPRGTPVVAMRGGKVIESGWNAVGGNSVLIQGDDGLQYYYAHGNEKPSVQVGQTVGAGAFLMPVGDTGDAKGTGTHLHIGIGPTIMLGADKYGGTGGDYDAVGMLQAALSGKASPQTGTPQAPSSQPPSTVERIGQGKGAFIQSLAPLADYHSQQSGIPASVYLAIAANETGWGKSQTAQQQNNLFSIQGDRSNGSRWAGYASPEESFSAFDRLVSTAPRYKQAWADRADPSKFINGLRTAGYVADEPGYPAQGWVNQVLSINNDLTQSGAVQAVQSQAAPSTHLADATRLSSPAASLNSRPMPPEVANPVVKYRDNGDGSYTATHQDGTTETVAHPTQIAPIEGGRHPTTVGAKPTSQKGAGQDDDPSYDIPILGGLKRAADAQNNPLNQATNQLDPLKRQYPVLGPGGLGVWDPRIGPPPEEQAKPDFSDVSAADASAGDVLASSTHPEDPSTYGAPGFSRAPRPSDVWTAPRPKGKDAFTPPQGMDDQQIAQLLLDHAQGKIDRVQLTSALGTQDVGSVRDYALSRAALGDRTLLDSMPLSLLHQTRFDMVAPEVAMFRDRARMGQGTLESRSPYRIPETRFANDSGWKPENNPGNGVDDAKGEVHTAGLYFDSNPAVARDRTEGDPTLYTELRVFKPEMLNKDQVLNLRDDPEASQVMEDAHRWATDEWTNRDGWNTGANWGELLQEYLLKKGYKVVYGGGLEHENGEAVLLDPDVDAYTRIIDSGPSKDMIYRARKLPGWDPHMLSGILLGTFVAAGAKAAQDRNQQVVAPGQPQLGTGQDEIDPGTSGGDADYIDPVTGLPRTDIQRNLAGVGDMFTALGTRVRDVVPEQPQSADEAAMENTPIVGGLARGARELGTTLDEQFPAESTRQQPYQPGTPEEEAEKARMIQTISGFSALGPSIKQAQTPEEAQQQIQEQTAQGLRAGAIAGSLAVPGVTEAALGPTVAGSLGGQALTGAAMSAVQQAPDIARAITSGDPEQIKEQAKQVAAGAVLNAAIPGLGKLNEAVDTPVTKAIANSPVGKYLTVPAPVSEFLGEESGGIALGQAARTALTTAKGGAVGAAVAAASAPSLLNPDPTNPDWWGHLKDDWVQGVPAGAVTGATVGLGASAARALADRTITPAATYAFRWIFDPRRNIPNAVAQVAASTRARGILAAHSLANILDAQAEPIFGASGQGFNTAKAAAYVEKQRTLAGFVNDAGESPTQAMIDWVKEQVAREDADQARMAAAKVIGPDQNVVTGPGLPGPKVHIAHVYDQDVAAAQARARGGRGLGWRDNTITHQRNKTIDPNIDPNTPRTIDEALALHAANPTIEPKPLDSLTTRFSLSAFQAERAIANRTFYDTVSTRVAGAPWAVGGPWRMLGNVVGDHHVTPNDWVVPKDEWGFGLGVDNMRFEPNLARYIDNLVNIGKGQMWEPFDWYGRNIGGPLKQLTFLGTPVHASNVFWRTLMQAGPAKTAQIFGGYIVPTIRNGFGELLRGNPALALDAAAHGVVPPRYPAGEGLTEYGSFLGNAARMGLGALGGASAGYTQAKLRNQTDEEARFEAGMAAIPALALGAPGGGKLLAGALRRGEGMSTWSNLADVIHQAVFSEGLPAAKLGLYDIMVRSGVDKSVAADITNSTVGGLNYMEMGRAPWVQDLMRYGLIAPDWTEGIVRTVAGAALPGPTGDALRGSITRPGLIRNLAAYMAFVELMNHFSTGHFMQDNPHGREFQLDATGLMNKLAQKPGWEGVASKDPVTHTDMGSYLEPIPPLSGVMQLISTLAQEGAYTQGQLEYKAGEMGLLPGGQQAGQQIMTRFGGNLARGEMPGPEATAKLAQEIKARLHPALGFAGALGEAARGEQRNFSGEPMDRPDLSTPSGALEFGARALSPLAPAVSTNLTQNVDLSQPWRTEPIDPLVEALGFTRVNRDTELSRNIAAQNRILTDFLHLTPEVQAALRDNRQADINLNEQQRADAFKEFTTPKSQTTAVALDNALHSLQDERKVSSQRNQIEKFVNLAPDWAQDTLRHMFQNVFNVQGGDLPADLKDPTGIGQLERDYWNPQGVKLTNQADVNKARSNILKQWALEHNEDPDSLEDQIKWNAQHQDLTTLPPPMTPIPNLTSGQLGQIATGYLQAAEDPNGHYIQDINLRGDQMRAYLDDTAKQLTQSSGTQVTPQSLLQRINVRLSSSNMALQTPISRSYDGALQTFFESRDPEQFPRYVDANGNPQGQRADWDQWDKEIANIGAARARYLPTEDKQGYAYRDLFAAQERGSNAREKFLIHNPNNLDYERFFGFGRSMTNDEWQQYASGKLTGYKDLDRFSYMDPPVNETIRRDKIQELYRASNADERLNTPVKIWVAGDYIDVPLIAAYRIARRNMINTAGRSLQSLAAHDDPNPSQPPPEASTVGAEDNGP